MSGRIGIDQSRSFSNTKRLLQNSLLDMGFGLKEVEKAFKYSKQKENMDELLNFLVKGPNGWTHPFRASLQSAQCKVCGETLQEHENSNNNNNIENANENGILLDLSDSSDDSVILGKNIASIENSNHQFNLNLHQDFQQSSVIRVSRLQQPNGLKISKLARNQDKNNDNNSNQMFCEICTELLPPEEMKQLPCKHNFCIHCIEQYILSSINSAKFFNIKCLEEGCQFVFQDEYIRTLVSATIAEKFFRLKEIAVLNADPNVIWCPNAGCNSYVMLNEENHANNCSEIACPTCSTLICLKCKRKAHAKKCCFFKKNCEEELNEEYEHWANGKPVQLCPHCSCRVEKTAGCNHIVCTVCNFDWCWLCRQQIIYGHYVISNPFGCPGMSGQEYTTQNSPKYKIYLKRLLIIILIILAFIIGLVIVYPLVFGIYLWLRFYHLKFTSCNDKIKQQPSKCIFYTYFTIYTIIGIIIFPIFVILAIFPCLPLFLFCPAWRRNVYTTFPASQAIAFNLQSNLLQRFNQH